MLDVQTKYSSSSSLKGSPQKKAKKLTDGFKSGTAHCV